MIVSSFGPNSAAKLLMIMEPGQGAWGWVDRGVACGAGAVE